MGAVKRFAEEVSVEMGLGGEITDEVLRVAQLRFQDALDARELVKEVAAELPSRITITCLEAIKQIQEKMDNEMDDFEYLELLCRIYPSLDDLIADAFSECDGQELADIYQDLFKGVKNVRFEFDADGHDDITFENFTCSER